MSKTSRSVSWKLRTHLLILIVLIFTPVLWLLIIQGYEDRRHRLEDVQYQAQYLIQLFIDEQEHLISRTRQLLEILSQVPAVRNLDPVECSRFLQAVHQYNPQYSTIVAANREGFINCCAIPLTKPIDVRDRNWFKRICETRSFVIDEFLISRSAYKASLPFAYPVLDDSGNLQAAVGAAFDLASYQQIFDKVPLPLDSVIIITDRKYNILYLYPNSGTDHQIGHPMVKIRGFTPPDHPKGAFTVIDADKVERYYLYERLYAGQPSNEVCLLLGFSTDAIFGKANYLMMLNIAVLSLVALLSLSVAMVFGKKCIVEPVNLLMQKIQSVSRDDWKAFNKISYPIQELERLSELFDNLIGEIDRQEAERRQAAEALRQSEERYRLVVENQTELVCRFIPDGTLIFVNDAYCRFVDKTKDELIGKKWHPFPVPEDLPYIHERLQTMSPMNPTVVIENRIYSGTGDIRWVQFINRGFFDSDGNLIEIQSVGRDITERRQTEELLRINERRYQKAQQMGHVGNWEYNVKTTYFWGSDEAKRIYGFDPDQSHFSTDEVENCIPERERVHQALVDLITEGKEYNLEFEIHPLNSSEPRFIASIAELQYNENGEPLVVGVIQDITERRRAETEIRRLNEELEERVRMRTAQLEAANKELESFSYSVSHDLRAPLRSIDGWTLAIAEDYADKLDEQGRQYIERVRTETQRMEQLIDDLLKLSRLTRGELQIDEVNLSELAQKVVNALQETDPNHAAEWVIAPDLTARADSGMMEIVLMNLIGNAWKFTKKTPLPKIEFGKAVLDPSKTKPEDAGKQLFFIKDNGAGFNPAYTQKLFGAFQRLHKASEFPGTGIGLAIVQRIIHRHGGRVWAEGAVNQGASFYFTL